MDINRKTKVKILLLGEIKMTENELISRIRNAIESDEDEICRVIEVKFLFDVYDYEKEVEV